jgi:hypothetical protein
MVGMIVSAEEDRQIGQVLDRLITGFPDVSADTMHEIVGASASASIAQRSATSSPCSSNGTPRRSLRISPAPPRIPSNQPPTEADRAQAAATADVLAQLIGDCDARMAT